MIEIKISGETVEEAKTAMRELLNGNVEVAVDLSAIPPILKPQNPVETDTTTVKQGTAPDPEIPAVDADNYPWDKRIHSTVHTRNTNGTWKLLKRPKSFGTDVEAWHKFIEEVRAELRGETSETQETGEQTTGVNPADVFGNESENPAAGVDSNTVVEQTTTIVNTDPPKDFPALMKFITSNGDKITIPNVGDICTNFNLPDVTALMKPEHADLIPLVYNSILEVIANGVPNES